MTNYLSVMFFKNIISILFFPQKDSLSSVLRSSFPYKVLMEIMGQQQLNWGEGLRLSKPRKYISHCPAVTSTNRKSEAHVVTDPNFRQGPGGCCLCHVSHDGPMMVSPLGTFRVQFMWWRGYSYSQPFMAWLSLLLSYSPQKRGLESYTVHSSKWRTSQEDNNLKSVHTLDPFLMQWKSLSR